MLFKSISLIILLTLSFTVNAAATNVFSLPMCVSDVKKLPIYMLRSKIKKSDSGFSLSSTFLVGKDLFATASHSIHHGSRKYVDILINGKTHIAKILHYDKERDFALLEAPSGDIEPMALATSADVIKKFTQVWTIGYPDYDRPHLHSYGGMLIKMNPEGFYKSNALGIKGMSGGPTIRCYKGKPLVLGVTVTIGWSLISDKVYTEKDTGIVVRERTIVNSGTSHAAPVKNMIQYIVVDENNYIIWENVQPN